MIRSMTGYGRAEGAVGPGNFVVELRSVNNRYLDVQVRLHRSIAQLEPRIRKAVQDRLPRGRVDVFISRTGEGDASVRLAVNYQLAGQYLEILRAMKSRFDLPGDVDLSLVSALPDVVTREDVTEDMDAVWEQLQVVLGRAVTGLVDMRSAEGEALGSDIQARLGRIQSIASEIAERAPTLVERSRARMEESLQRLLKEPPDPARLAQEIALLADRTDVTEELTRLGIHLKQFRILITTSSGEPVGRKLDFLLQEMGREVNTIASKVMDADISLNVVNIKSELEKIREQVQNIE